MRTVRATGGTCSDWIHAAETQDESVRVVYPRERFAQAFYAEPRSLAGSHPGTQSALFPSHGESEKGHAQAFLTLEEIQLLTRSCS